MEPSSQNVDTYISSLPQASQDDIQTLDQEISNIMKGLPRKLWTGTFWGGSEQNIIGYGDMTYTRSDKQVVNWFLVGLALQKNYISVYVSTYKVKDHAAKLGNVKIGASNISFRSLKDLNLDELRVLLRDAQQQAGAK